MIHLSVEIYDTTLRDGAQSPFISFSVEDKIKIAKKLDELGIHFIEGGYPSSNPKDAEFFRRIKNLNLNAEIVAFGSTKRPKIDPEEDSSLKAIIDAGTKYVCIFGKSWTLHVKHVLKISLEENLRIIEETIEFLKDKGKKVIFDAEHFFDGFKEDKDYAMKVLKTAEKSGAECLVLCDTNGGCLPFEVEKIISYVLKHIDTKIGVHMHNDSDNAVANTLIAVKLGARHVQGTINGYGERCGNANLCSIIPALKLKMKINCISDEKLKKLYDVARYVAEVANLPLNHNMPYVGDYAFAHKAGVHIDAMLKNIRTYEHINPELVGNERRFLVSELSGRSAIVYLLRSLGENVRKDSSIVSSLLKEIKDLEKDGYQFDIADASLKLFVLKKLKKYKRFFEVEDYKVLVDYSGEKTKAVAIVKVKVDDRIEYEAAEGNGPVNALDIALRKCIEKFYPEIKDMRLIDYKVRVLDEEKGTGAKVRVLIESSDGKESWITVGVSTNIIEASFRALIDSIEYKLYKRYG